MKRRIEFKICCVVNFHAIFRVFFSKLGNDRSEFSSVMSSIQIIRQEISCFYFNDSRLSHWRLRMKSHNRHRVTQVLSRVFFGYDNNYPLINWFFFFILMHWAPQFLENVNNNDETQMNIIHIQSSIGHHWIYAQEEWKQIMFKKGEPEREEKKKKTSENLAWNQQIREGSNCSIADSFLFFK